MGKGKAPKPPNMSKLVDQQTSSNIGTSIVERMMNMGGGIETPDGSVSYSQSGTYDYVDPVSGKKYSIPLMKSTSSLSPQQQAIKDKSDAAKLIAADTAGMLAKQFQDAGNFEDDIENKIYGYQMKRVQPQVDMMRTRAITDATNRGIRPGTAAYDALMRTTGEQENDAYNQMALTSRSMALGERAQRAGEIGTFMGMGQPGTAPAPEQFQSTLPSIDRVRAGTEDYQNKMAAYQQKSQTINQALGGMFGIAGNFIKYSDRRLKTDIKRVGKTDDGQGIYQYRYKAGGGMHLGLMAQEVEKKHPDAVSKDAFGFRRVDYSKALEGT
jgi:hypothetical protein